MSDATRRCPICGKPADVRYRPFCSRRCADIDLGRWFGEFYTVKEGVSGATPPPEDEEAG